MQFMRVTKISNADLMINLFTSKNNNQIQWQCAQQWLFTDIQVVTFLYIVAFHRLALNRCGNILGGIIGIHQYFWILDISGYWIFPDTGYFRIFLDTGYFRIPYISGFVKKLNLHFCDSHDALFLQSCVVLQGYLNMIHMFKNPSF